MARASSQVPPTSPAGVTQVLCAVVLVLMAGAVVYSALTAVRYFGMIGV